MENTNKKILFLIPDGVGIRNYLYSDILSTLKKDAKIVFWSTLPEEAFEDVKTIHEIDIDYKKLNLNIENLCTRIYRESSTYARLLLNSSKVNNPTILTFWRKENKNFKLRQLYTIAEFIGAWAAKKEKRILFLENKSKNNWKKSIIESYIKELKFINPTSIFITHQRVASLMPICIAAKQLGIPVVTAIYSWDNLPKGRLSVQADKFIVWSDYMKEEMALYYPEIQENDVIVTGTPQFEFYFKEELLEKRLNFANLYGLDQNKKWICFSGDDKTSSPNDPQYLKDVMDALKLSDSEKNYQVIFRRCPADFSSRYDDVLSNYNEIVSIDPLWYTKNTGWNSFFPQYADVGLLANIIYHCDLVINVGSTMAHDFAVMNKPCLYLKFDKKNHPKWSSELVYNFQHFRTMQGLDAVGWLNSPDEIAEKIQMALKFPDQVGKDRKKWLEKIVLHPLDENSRKIAHVLLNPN